MKYISMLKYKLVNRNGHASNEVEMAQIMYEFLLIFEITNK